MQIENSLDWQAVHAELRTQLGQLPFNPDLRRMLANITDMVTDLSKVEVEARRKNMIHITEPKVKAINEAIDRLEKLLLLGQLLK
jgi:hypothetical protein